MTDHEGENKLSAEAYIKLSERMSELEKQIQILRTKFLCEDYMINSINNNSKKPYKCPVCDGRTKQQYNLPAGGYWEDKCHTCDGKGIVWG
jgi:DnaJ-class molecular chaperone